MSWLLSVHGSFMTGWGLSRTMKVDLVQRYRPVLACILERGTLIHPYCRSKSDYTDFVVRLLATFLLPGWY